MTLFILLFALLLPAQLSPAAAADSLTLTTCGPLATRLLRKIDSLPIAKDSIHPAQGIFYQKYPLAGSYPAAVFDTAASSMLRFLSAHGRARTIPLRDLAACLLDHADSCAGFRYVFTPYEFHTATHEKKMQVGSFVKLNRNGDFIPANTQRTIMSAETETSIRFVLIDLDSGRIVFNTTEKAKISDKGTIENIGDLEKSGGEAGEAKEQSKSTAMQRSVIGVVVKIKIKLKRRFGG